MCFTIEVHMTRKAIERRFSVDTSALYDFDYSYFYRAFSNPIIPVIAQEDPNHIQMMQWGLIPSWAEDRKKAEQIRKGTYNARAESLHEKPSFREPLLNRRCGIIAHGFFEWQLVNGVRIPWYIRLKSDAPFVFAGLYDSWIDPAVGEAISTFTIITTRANPLMEKIHNTKKRMPVILDPKGESGWITGDISIRKARQLLFPIEEGKLHAHTISNAISRAGAKPDNPHIIQPYDHPVPGSLF